MNKGEKVRIWDLGGRKLFFIVWFCSYKVKNLNCILGKGFGLGEMFCKIVLLVLFLRKKYVFVMWGMIRVVIYLLIINCLVIN